MESHSSSHIEEGGVRAAAVICCLVLERGIVYILGVKGLYVSGLYSGVRRDWVGLGGRLNDFA